MASFKHSNEIVVSRYVYFNTMVCNNVECTKIGGNNQLFLLTVGATATMIITLIISFSSMPFKVYLLSHFF